MSVVVRMEMPKNCEMCRLRVNDSPTNVPNWICAINQWPTFYCKKSQNHADEDKYLQGCPILCQLPEGHGRLGDFNALKREVLQFCKGCNRYTGDYYCDNFCKIRKFMNVIDAQKTIVPAERSET